MAIHYGIAGVRETITTVRPSAIEFPAPMGSTINRLFVRIAVAVAGDVIFDINVDGVSIFPDLGDRPRILEGDTTAEAFFSEAVTEFQMISVDVDDVPLGGISGLYVGIQIQDATTIERYIEDAYVGALNRTPTGPEASAAAADLEAECIAGNTLNQAKVFFDDIFNGAEYTGLATSDDDFVEDLYQAVLGRPSDPGGKAFWLSVLAGPATRQNLQDAFYFSVEHVNSRVTGWCPQTLPMTNAIKLQGFEIDGTAPTDDQVLMWDTATSRWIPTDLPGGGGPATQLDETSGPDTLDIDDIPNGTWFRRVGSNVIGDLLPIEIGVACSDETTALSTGAAKATFRVPCDMELTDVRASVTTAPTGAAVVVDINVNNSTILSTKITIDATEKTSLTATPPVISSPSLTEDDEVTIDIDTVGSTIAGAGLKVWLIGTR